MGLFNAVMALSGMIDTDVVEDERLARHTSYRIGGKADLFVTCHSYHALRRAVAVLDREQVPWVIIGKGSNLLVADAGYRGAVISLGREFQRTVVAEDGCSAAWSRAPSPPCLPSRVENRASPHPYRWRRTSRYSG